MEWNDKTLFENMPLQHVYKPKFSYLGISLVIVLDTPIKGIHGQQISAPPPSIYSASENLSILDFSHDIQHDSEIALKF